MIAPGTRIGAFYALGRTRAILFGYGAYEGDFAPPEDILGTMGPVGRLGVMVPRLKLDDGTILWGCECWWATEEEVRSLMAGVRLSIVRIETLRNRNRARWERACRDLDLAEEQLS